MTFKSLNFAGFGLAFALSGALTASALAAPPAAPPAAKAPIKKPAAPVVTCKLLTPEAPRGGRLEVEGEHFGDSPVVRIAGKAVPILERAGERIAVQIPRKSDGGPVTVKAEGQEAACGTLTIIGKN